MYIQVIYAVWFLIPTVFFLIALWGKLEKLSGSTKNYHPADYVRQGCYVLVCVLISLAIDRFLLQPYYPDWIEEFPLPMAQVLLLPFVLALAAKITGGTKPIRITKAGRTKEVKEGRR
jgi:hypothetical protein